MTCMYAWGNTSDGLCVASPRICSIFDGQPIPVLFAPSLYKFLLGLPVNMHDLEAFDPVSAMHLYQCVFACACACACLRPHAQVPPLGHPCRVRRDAGLQSRGRGVAGARF